MDVLYKFPEVHSECLKEVSRRKRFNQDCESIFSTLQKLIDYENNSREGYATLIQALLLMLQSQVRS